MIMYYLCSSRFFFSILQYFSGGELSLVALRGTFVIRMNSDCDGFEGNMTEMKVCAGYANGGFSICQVYYLLFTFFFFE